MKALIIGCGKFGVRISEYLNRKNHDVVVVDKNPETFHALGDEFTGRTLCGVGYDKDILDRAGIATTDVVIACTSSDSLNAVVSNIAKNIYHVPTVIARMYDPVRARMFETMGIYTISITRLGLENVTEYLEGKHGWSVVRKLGMGVQLVKAHVLVGLVGTPFSELEESGKIKITALERQGHSLLPQKDMYCDYNDVLYLAVETSYLAKARDMMQL